MEDRKVLNLIYDYLEKNKYFKSLNTLMRERYSNSFTSYNSYQYGCYVLFERLIYSTMQGN